MNLFETSCCLELVGPELIGTELPSLGLLDLELPGLELPSPELMGPVLPCLGLPDLELPNLQNHISEKIGKKIILQSESNLLSFYPTKTNSKSILILI